MNIPEPGFYYHYKHMVVYYPLYQTDIAPATCFVRPVELFFDEVECEGKMVPHFTKIADSGLIAKLFEIKSQQQLS